MTTITSTATATRPRLDISRVLTDSWRVFLKDIGTLLIAALIACVLTVLTLGILAGPLAAGLIGMVIGRVRDDQRPEVGDLFAQMHRFWTFFGAAVALVLLIGFACLTIVGGIILATIWLYVFPLMVDRGLGLSEALKTSKDMVVEGGFWEHLALLIVLVMIGAVANGALAILATPFSVVVVVVAYYLSQGRGDAVE